jgi:hypothetical protein
MSRRFSFVLLVCSIPVLAATPTSTAPSAQQGGVVSVAAAKGWEMTDEDRIARRVLGRVGYRESIDGRTHPELFMPYELFDHLLLALSSDGARARRYHGLFDPRVRAFGYDDTRFWTILRSAAIPYLRAREEHEKRHERHTVFRLPGGGTSMVAIHRDDCAARIEALQKARRALGGVEFDRFLYSMVAATDQHSEGGSAADRAQQLRYMARGCK